MNSNVRRALTFPFLATMLASPWLLQCGKVAVPPAVTDATGGALASCPDISTAEAALKSDFTKTFGISAEAGAKLRAGTAAAIELKGFADKLDADLKVACGGLAKDLGAAGEPKDGTEACNLAVKAMGDVKAKLGAGAKIALVMKPPMCSADMNVMTDCAANCDAKIKPGSVKAECEPGKLSGECTGKCEGTCDAKVAGKCEGECSGTCDVDIKGQCGGSCKGKCDGKTTGAGASCAGTCEGKCDANVKAECKGKCGGSCALKAKATCEGTCSGKCDVEMKAPKCTGEIKPPEMSADCKAHCDAQVNAKMECTPATVSLAISGAADAKAATDLKAAVEKNLPAIVKIAQGMGPRAAKMAMNGKAVIEGLEGSITEIAKTSGDPAKAGMIGGKITGCVGGTFKDAVAAAGGISANVDVSVKVQASASASGSASSK